METLSLESEGVRLEPAVKRHARELARILRVKDLDEIKATGGRPEAGIRRSLNLSSEAYAVYKNKDLLCVFGVAELPQVQVMWMQSSVYVDKYQMTFWRCSKKVVTYLRGKYPLMMNMIHGKYTEAMRWAERLGFTISPPEKFGVRGDLFCRATMVTQPVSLALTSRDDSLMELIHV